VVATVEQIAGVRFGALFDRLPRTVPDGDAAIAAVWELVLAEKGRRAERMEETLRQFEPLLQQLAAAVDDPDQQAALAETLADLAAKGWQLTAPVHRLWAGERDAAALTAGIDGNSAQLVRRLLALVAG
jgi:hypothetical protein